jgi:hypothetical protein
MRFVCISNLSLVKWLHLPYVTMKNIFLHQNMEAHSLVDPVMWYNIIHEIFFTLTHTFLFRFLSHPFQILISVIIPTRHFVLLIFSLFIIFKFTFDNDEAATYSYNNKI